MTSPDYKRRQVAQLTDAEAKIRAAAAKYSEDAGKKRTDAAGKREQAGRTSSASTKMRYLKEAAKLEEDAGKLDKKASAETKKLGQNLRNQASAQRGLEQAEASQRRKQQRDDLAHARAVVRVSAPATRIIHEVRHVPEPKPEPLRVAYLTANPRVVDSDPDTGEQWLTRIRVDKEVRDVQEEVRRSLHRDAIEIKPWVAATPMDVLNALNDQKPHVMHFSGHGGGGFLEFDDGQLKAGSQNVSLEHLARALGATDQPPQVVVLNACDTLEDAAVLLPAVPVVIATATNISDPAANLFALRFYAAIASGRSLAHAVEQARFAMDVLAGGAGDVIQSLTREGVELDELVLVKSAEDLDDEAGIPEVTHSDT